MPLNRLLLVPALAGLIAAAVPAHAEDVSLFTLLRAPLYEKTWSSLGTAEPAMPAWLRDLNVVANPVKTVVVDGTPYWLSDADKEHATDKGQAAILFAMDGSQAWACADEEGKARTCFGNPSPAQRAALDKLLGGPAEEAASGAGSANAGAPDGGLAIAATGKLPRAPKSERSCEPPVPNPATAGGALIHAQGWGVLAEARLGDYSLVGFASRFEAGTSGACLVGDGNVAVYDGSQLRAIIYAPKGSKATIGSLQELPGRVRILDGDYVGMPVADIVPAAAGNRQPVALDAVAASDPICAGQGVVPNVYGKPINAARQSVMAQGWEPRRNPNDLASNEDMYGRQNALSKRGVIEVDSCSGTGLAYCNFIYRKGDMELSLTTYGDDDFPTVSGYLASCERSKWTSDQPDSQ